jgi:predicted methyltransferase MtxX (methanogen marker protein 4)
VANKLASPSPTPAADHFHRWRIDEPNGPMSTGVCKECGVTKTFKNWLQDGDFITNEEHRSAAA